MNSQPMQSPPLTRSWNDLAADPTYRIFPVWIGGHGSALDAVPIESMAMPAQPAQPVYRQWYGGRDFEVQQ